MENPRQQSPTQKIRKSQNKGHSIIEFLIIIFFINLIIVLFYELLKNQNRNHTKRLQLIEYSI